jgi:hypothetical protein
VRQWRVTETQKHVAFVALYEELRAVYPADVALDFKPSHCRVTHIAHGWYMRVLRSTEGVLLMREAGLSGESFPLRRAALEHVLALRWLAEKGNDAADVVIRMHGETSKRRQQASSEAGWVSANFKVWDEVAQDAQAATANVSENNILTNMTERTAKYGHPTDMAAWLLETNNSHPGWSTVSPYWDRAAMRPLTHSRLDGRLDAALCCSDLLRGLEALNRMMKEPMWDDLLRALAERFDALQADLPGPVEAENAGD